MASVIMRQQCNFENFPVPDCLPRFFHPVNHQPSSSPLPVTRMASRGRRVCTFGHFTVLSYNILSQIYINTAKYHYCPEWALTWKYRRHNLLREILEYDADILCLQEVQSDHFDNFFAPQLFRHGYSGMYKRKMQEVMADGQFVMDGCAIFFRNDRFDLVKTYEVEFDKPARRVVDKLGKDERKNGLFRLLKGNIALALILEEKGSRDAVKSRICVANTHIHANPRAPDVKLFQVVKFIQGLEKIAASQIPVVACGDMNSLPGSDPYRFVVEGRVERSNEPDPLRVYEDLKLSHSIQLASAYSRLYGRDREEKMQCQGMEPPFTSLTPKFRGTLDYMFYTEDKMEVDGLLELPNDQGLLLPSPLRSSDHVALMANFIVHPKFQKIQYSIPPHDPWEQQ